MVIKKINLNKNLENINHKNRGNFLFNKKGFTIIEMMVSVIIMSVAVVGMMVISSSGVVNLRYLKDKMTATMLSNEGIELVHNFRDSYVINPDSGGWDGFISSVSGCESGCAFDALYPGVINSCTEYPDAPCQNLKVINGAYTYGATGAIDTKFTRLIKIAPVGATGEELEVSSSVFWKQGSITHSVSSSTSLMNWLDEAPAI